MGAIVCPETLLGNYQNSLRNNPEECGSQVTTLPGLLTGELSGCHAAPS